MNPVDVITPLRAPAPFVAAVADRYLDEVDDNITLAAQVRVPVLITAENRNRRSMCARLIHAHGLCGLGPFVTFSGNGAGPPVADSAAAVRRDDETFRHLFDQARGGTLFIEDAATLSRETQAVLLALLDELAPHHSSTVLPAERTVRLITGASRELDDARANGAFCELLFYRLNVVRVDLMNGDA